MSCPLARELRVAMNSIPLTWWVRQGRSIYLHIHYFTVHCVSIISVLFILEFFPIWLNHFPRPSEEWRVFFCADFGTCDGVEEPWSDCHTEVDVRRKSVNERVSERVHGYLSERERVLLFRSIVPTWEWSLRACVLYPRGKWMSLSDFALNGPSSRCFLFTLFRKSGWSKARHEIVLFFRV